MSIDSPGRIIYTYGGEAVKLVIENNYMSKWIVSTSGFVPPSVADGSAVFSPPDLFLFPLRGLGGRLFLIPPYQMNITMQLLAFNSIQADKVYNAGVVVNSIRTISFAEFIRSVPIDVFVSGLKNNAAPPVVNFEIDVEYIFVWRAIFDL